MIWTKEVLTFNFSNQSVNKKSSHTVRLHERRSKIQNSNAFAIQNGRPGDVAGNQVYSYANK